MTRFNITLEKYVLVIKVIKSMVGGEIFVPKIPSFKVTVALRRYQKNLKLKLLE